MSVPRGTWAAESSCGRGCGRRASESESVGVPRGTRLRGSRRSAAGGGGVPRGTRLGVAGRGGSTWNMRRLPRPSGRSTWNIGAQCVRVSRPVGDREPALRVRDRWQSRVDRALRPEIMCRWPRGRPAHVRGAGRPVFDSPASPCPASTRSPTSPTSPAIPTRPTPTRVHR